MDVCPGANHVCMNGGECSPVRDELGSTSNAIASLLSIRRRCMREYCEFESTGISAVPLMGWNQNGAVE
jgi:hypothetical protein